MPKMMGWEKPVNFKSVFSSPWVKLVLCDLVDVEASGGGGDVEPLVLQGDDKDVHQVSVHPSLARWRVPSRRRQDLEAGHPLGFLVGRVQWQQWPR